MDRSLTNETTAGPKKISSRLQYASGLDFLSGTGRTLFHETMHTNLITDCQPTIDAQFEVIANGELVNRTMYGAWMCSLVAGAGTARGGGLPMSCQNADSYTLATSILFWKDQFGDELPLPEGE
jgi:hypothetical protein